MISRNIDKSINILYEKIIFYRSVLFRIVKDLDELNIARTKECTTQSLLTSSISMVSHATINAINLHLGIKMTTLYFTGRQLEIMNTIWINDRLFVFGLYAIHHRIAFTIYSII